MSLEHPLHNVDGEYVDIWAQPLAVIKLFPFMRLPEIMRRVVLEFVLTVAPPEQTLDILQSVAPAVFRRYIAQHGSVSRASHQSRV